MGATRATYAPRPSGKSTQGLSEKGADPWEATREGPTPLRTGSEPFSSCLILKLACSKREHLIKTEKVWHFP